MALSKDRAILIFATFTRCPFGRDSGRYGSEPAEPIILIAFDDGEELFLEGGGDGSALAGVPVFQPGSDLQQEIWAAVRAIPSGETATYGEIALEVGRPRAARAVGTACARNLTTPFTPCHRVVSASGIGGFGGAPSLKRLMLELEQQ